MTTDAWQDATVADNDFTWNSVRVNGNWIHYRVAGPVDAPPMIHVHGFGISGNYLMPTAELLTDSFRVYVPDLPGFGRSPKPAEQLSIEELGNAVLHFMDELGLEQTVLVGHSLGCAISSEAIAEAPERVSKAVLVALAGGPHNQPMVKGMLQMVRDSVREPPAMLMIAAPDYRRFGVVRALKLFNWMTKFPAFERFMSLPVPVLAVLGSEDPLRPPWTRINELMPQLPPHLSIVVFQGAAHSINFTHPRELAHTIRQYVAGEPIRMDANFPQGIPVLPMHRSDGIPAGPVRRPRRGRPRRSRARPPGGSRCGVGACLARQARRGHRTRGPGRRRGQRTGGVDPATWGGLPHRCHRRQLRLRLRPAGRQPPRRRRTARVVPAGSVPGPRSRAARRWHAARSAPGRRRDPHG